MENKIFEMTPKYWAVNIGDSGWLKKSSTGLSWQFQPPFACLNVASQLSQWLPELEYQPQVSARSVTGKSGNPIPGVKNIIAITSAKGGVGKSSVTVNIATALATMGVKVGILDADIYGPSIPLLLGLEGAQPSSLDGKTMEPLKAHGVYANSIGFLQPPEQAAIWRGPMASKALMQLLQETNWPDLDYLFIDMPPGTGDIQLTLAQQMPVTASVVVTTPQSLAVRDARKGISMFEQVDVPVLGIIENMSYYTCPDCGKSHHLFGEHGASLLSSATQLPLLGQLPFDPQVNQCNEVGDNLQDLANDCAALYQDLAEQLVTRLYFSSTARAEAIDIQVV
ncbi:iron-sulfur cluster carrier protein ApbC [Celerinatantimonas sp. YJH-8]|uniref:iron-sulfur cluster carrier protein ApbC n=1 Tax=Celerinatantimonas sp. YJH-8 TaxID=3228714 RepID=UPI0038C9FE44